MFQLFLVFVGGGLGAAGRHLVGQGAVRFFGFGFPYGTLIVNVLGCLAMGLLIGWLVRRGGSQDMRLFLATGVLGGFTTFSAFSLDVANLWERGAGGQAATYILASVVISIAAVFAGLWLTRSAGV